MVKSNRGRAMGNSMGLPADDWIDRAEKLAPDTDSPGFQRMLEAVRAHPDLYVVDALSELAYEYGFDPTDPDVIEKAVDSARMRAARREEWQRRAGELRRAHDPVVYYMRVGNRVKIGTTANIIARLETIAPEELVTMEWGARALELKRHRQFAHLRTAREWFRLEAEVADHVAATTAAFEDRFGQPLKTWMNGHRAVPGGD